MSKNASEHIAPLLAEGATADLPSGTERRKCSREERKRCQRVGRKNMEEKETLNATHRDLASVLTVLWMLDTDVDVTSVQEQEKGDIVHGGGRLRI